MSYCIELLWSLNKLLCITHKLLILHTCKQRVPASDQQNVSVKPLKIAATLSYSRLIANTEFANRVKATVCSLWNSFAFKELYLLCCSFLLIIHVLLIVSAHCWILVTLENEHRHQWWDQHKCKTKMRPRQWKQCLTMSRLQDSISRLPITDKYYDVITAVLCAQRQMCTVDILSAKITKFNGLGLI